MDAITRLSATFEAINGIDRTLQPFREIQERLDGLRLAIDGPVHRHLWQTEVFRLATEPQGLGLSAAYAGLRQHGLAEIAKLSPSYGLAAAATANWKPMEDLAGLGAFRLGHEQLADRLALGGPALQGMREHWADTQFGTAFSGLSAFSTILRGKGNAFSFRPGPAPRPRPRVKCPRGRSRLGNRGRGRSSVIFFPQLSDPQSVLRAHKMKH